MNFIRKTKSILYGMEFTHGIRRALMGALALVYFVSLGFNVVSITTLFAISGIIMMLFEFPTGAIADYDSRKKSLVISFLLLSIAFFGLFIFKNFWLLAFSWILGDIAWTFSTGAGSAWAIDALKYAKEKSKIVSLISRGYFFEKGGHIIGGIIGFVIVAINFRFVWLAISLTNLLMMFILIFYMEERNFKPAKVPHNYLKKSLIKAKESFSYVLHKSNGELRTLLLGGFISVIAISSFFVGVPLLLTQVLGMKPEFLAGLFSIFAVISLGATFVAEKLSHKKGIRISLIVVSLIIGISIIAFSLSPYLLLAIIALGIFQVAETMNDILEDSARQHEFSSKIRASLGSLNSINWTISNSIGVFLAGIGISFLGLIHTMIISGVLGIFVVVIYLIGLKK
jgi:MFS family permease|tara:strand:- start:207 stop:1400 length:1194 start_codon:yes stop_codon:yes gene_type:complete